MPIWNVNYSKFNFEKICKAILNNASINILPIQSQLFIEEIKQLYQSIKYDPTQQDVIYKSIFYSSIQ